MNLRFLKLQLSFGEWAFALSSQYTEPGFFFKALISLTITAVCKPALSTALSSFLSQTAHFPTFLPHWFPYLTT